MKLNIALPGLLWPDKGDIEYIYSDLKINNINSLVKHSSVSTMQFGYGDLLYSQDINGNSDSMAYQIAQKLGVLTKYTTFLIAEPTHLRLDRDRLLICEAELLQLNNSEVDEIVNAINNHFNQEIMIYNVKPNLWLIGLNIDLQGNTFYPILDIIGENINEYLPDGQNSIEFSRLLNEIQMLLFNLPINETRQDEGLLIINSLWLWDKKINSNITNHFNNIIMGTNDMILKNLKSYTKHDLIIIDKLYYPCRYRDCYSWRSNLETIDATFGSTLLKLYNSGQLDELNIFIPGNNQTVKLSLNKFNRYKFWKQQNLVNLSRILI